jgi:hypothetical protein
MTRCLRTVAAFVIGIAILATPMVAATGPLVVTYYFLPG